VLNTYNCLPTQPCFCNNDRLENDMTACLTRNGCTFEEQLAAKTFQAVACGLDVRDRGILLAAVSYTLFAISALCTIVSLLSRWSTLRGTGHGLDDLAAGMCFAVLTVMTVAVSYGVKHGEGKDIWGLSSREIMDFTKVCRIRIITRHILTSLSGFTSTTSCTPS
jgi:hypothetical protein